jgi:hypothetical protein
MTETATLAPGHSGAWQEATREVTGASFACTYSENGCPCCTCDESSAVRVVYTRLRWSQSRKRHMGETTVEFLCMAHMSENVL